MDSWRGPGTQNKHPFRDFLILKGPQGARKHHRQLRLIEIVYIISGVSIINVKMRYIFSSCLEMKKINREELESVL